MPILSTSAANRLGFILIGACNAMVYTSMLAAAFDLLSKSSSGKHGGLNPADILKQPNTSSVAIGAHKKLYCNAHSTSTILLADTLPALVTKLIYPFLLVSVPPSYKAIATAFFTASAFLTTGLSTGQLFVFAGVVCASLSFGLGESFYLSITPLYGNAAISSWSLGTGLAAFFGSFTYALLRMVLSVKQIMMILLLVPVTILFAYFRLITRVEPGGKSSVRTNKAGQQQKSSPSNDPFEQAPQTSNFLTKIHHLRSLSKYFLPLLLVYFSEYLINQGLFQLIYYPEVTYLDHGAQYRWFMVSYQFGVMLSRSSLELFKIDNIWLMSLLQLANLILFLAHTTKLIHLPNFYLVIGLIVYEGLLGGFTYVNAFYRVKMEDPPQWREFSISAVTTADSLGIVLAGLAALPVHDALCQLYV